MPEIEKQKRMKNFNISCHSEALLNIFFPTVKMEWENSRNFNRIFINKLFAKFYQPDN